MTDEEKVLDRLTWEDDDIVAYCPWNGEPYGLEFTRSFMRTPLIRRADGTNCTTAEHLRKRIHDAPLTIIMPFLSSDGVLFTP